MLIWSFTGMIQSKSYVLDVLLKMTWWGGFRAYPNTRRYLNTMYLSNFKVLSYEFV